MICQRDILRMPADNLLLAAVPAAVGIVDPMYGRTALTATARFLEHLASEGILGPWETAVYFSFLIGFPSVFRRYLGSRGPSGHKAKDAEPLHQGTALRQEILWSLPVQVLCRGWAVY